MDRLTIRQIRLAKEVSIEQVAEFLNIHPNTYAIWEKDSGKITIENGLKLCDFFGVEFDASIFLPNEATKCCEG